MKSFFPRALLFLALTISYLSGSALCQSVSTNEPAPLPLKESTRPDLPAGWRVIELGNPVKVSFAFPGFPKYVGQKSDDNPPIISQIYMSDEQAGAFFSVVLQSSEGNSPSKSLTEKEKVEWFVNWSSGFVDAIIKTQGTNLVATVRADRRIRQDGIEGFERDLTLGLLSVRLRVFFVGGELVAAVAMWPEAKPENANNKFFPSLVLHLAHGSADAAKIASPISDWKEYELANKAFVVRLPADPKVETVLVKADDGTELKGTNYVVADGRQFYSLNLLPGVQREGVRGKDHAAFYSSLWPAVEATINKMIRTAQGTNKLVMSAVRPLEVSGVAAEEKTFRLGSFDGRARIFISEGRFFMILAGWSLETPLAERLAFLNSFRLNETGKQ
jgi:hypothetical protein